MHFPPTPCGVHVQTNEDFIPCTELHGPEYSLCWCNNIHSNSTLTDYVWVQSLVRSSLDYIEMSYRMWVTMHAWLLIPALQKHLDIWIKMTHIVMATATQVTNNCAWAINSFLQFGYTMARYTTHEG
jgi:hypothetical protein